MARIFLSYAEEDRQVAERLAHKLEALGWTVWWDRTIPAGKTWREAIEAALKEMDSMVVLWSHHSVKSVWVLEEAEEGRAQGKLVPVFIESVAPPLGFRSIHAADLTAWDGSGEAIAFRRLVTGLEPLLGRPGSAVVEEGPRDDTRTPSATHQAVDTQSLPPAGSRGRLRRALISALIGIAAILAVTLEYRLRTPAEVPPPAATATPKPAPAATPKPAPPVSHLARQEALLVATSETLAEARLHLPVSSVASGRRALVVDFPAEDTRTAGNGGWSASGRAADLVREQYPAAEVVPMSVSNIAQTPLILIGHIYRAGKLVGSAIEPEIYYVCAVLADLKSGKIAGRHTLRVEPLKPARKSSDTFQSGTLMSIEPRPPIIEPPAPIWRTEPTFVETTRMCTDAAAGDPIDPAYVERIEAIALTGEAADAYNGGRYEAALNLYRRALGAPGVDRTRVLNGIYLTNAKLGRPDDAARAFGRIVDFQLAKGELPMKILFQPRSAEFIAEASISAPYTMWLQEIGAQSAEKRLCLEIVGHSDTRETDAAGDALSLARAERIKRMLETEFPQLASRIVASGHGSRENMIGIATSDMRDALDRRVEFRVVGCK